MAKIYSHQICMLSEKSVLEMALNIIANAWYTDG